MSEPRDRFVYGIFEIEDGKEIPRYIGMGKGGRMYEHLRDARRGGCRGRTTPKDLILLRR